MSVWAFREVFDHCNTLALPTAGTIRLPTIAGFVALKLAAWLDRSPSGVYKDATDLAAAMYWYAESPELIDELFGNPDGIELLSQYEIDTRRGAAHLLGQDVRGLIGPTRLSELSKRWPGTHGAVLPVEMALPNVADWPDDSSARLDILNAFEHGMSIEATVIE